MQSFLGEKTFVFVDNLIDQILMAPYYSSRRIDSNFWTSTSYHQRCLIMIWKSDFRDVNQIMSLSNG